MFFSNALVATSLLATLINGLPAITKPIPRASDGKRLTVYWGAEDDGLSLDEVCADDSYSIVNLAFLAYFHSDGGQPSISIQGLDDSTDAQRNAGATGLKDGSPIVPAIKACQAAGKLVILSMGGATDYADVTLSGDSDGEDIADKVWNLFLGGQSDLRPFGDVKLDGVDLGVSHVSVNERETGLTFTDNESGNATGYLAMVMRLKSHIASDSSKKYYLTAAPQCPFPDASEPLDVCKELDMVWVQFYNNGDW